MAHLYINSMKNRLYKISYANSDVTIKELATTFKAEAEQYKKMKNICIKTVILDIAKLKELGNDDLKALKEDLENLYWVVFD